MVRQWNGWFAWWMCLIVVFGGCYQAPQCLPPMQIIVGRCLLPCIEGDVNYCARDAALDGQGDGSPAEPTVDGDGSAFEDGTDVVADSVNAEPCRLASERRCSNVCVDVESSTANCGACGNRCAMVVNGTAACEMGRCAVNCAGGFQANSGQCVSATSFPRPIMPLSLGDVSVLRPTLRWQLRDGFDGARVELCRDRMCTQVIETIRASGSSTRPTMDLPTSSVVFWRLRGMVSMSEAPTYGPTWLFHVPARNARLGVEVNAHAHNDVNGDGFDDLVIGAPHGGNPAIELRLGSMRGISAMPQLIRPNPQSAEFGSAVAAAGDVNGDGFGDVLVGAPRSEEMGRSGAGAALLYLGNAAGVLGAPIARLAGEMNFEGLGSAVAGAGDVNGDGYADIVVGTPSAGPNGSARVFHGRAAGVSPVADTVLEGTVATQSFGFAVASAGDVNADGFSDIIVGAPLTSGGGFSDYGTASVFAGSVGGIVARPIRVLAGETAGEHFGTSVGGAIDVNGDGYSDVIVGAPQTTIMGRLGCGRASVFLGIDGGVQAVSIRAIDGDVGEFLGESVALVGDVNGDGFGDLAVGVPRASPMSRMQAGKVLIVTGAPAGPAVGVSQVLNGLSANDNFGSAISSGDLNGDGFVDLIVGSPFAAPMSRQGAGSVSVFQSSVAGVPALATTILDGPVAGANYGTAVAALGWDEWVLHRIVVRPAIGSRWWIEQWSASGPVAKI